MEVTGMVSWMRRRLTYANVLVTALAFLVLAGTSVAQDAVTSATALITGKQVKNGSLTGKDVKDHSLTKKDFKGSVRGATGPQGIQGVQGPQGPQGVKGDTGAPGTARAYARVLTLGTFAPNFDSSRTSGFTAVSRPQTGVYCLTPAAGIAPDSLPSVVSVDWYSSTPPEGDGSAMTTRPNNCSDAQFEVHTQRRGATTSAAPANDVAFTIIVP
jgi:hypothetical protein